MKTMEEQSSNTRSSSKRTTQTRSSSQHRKTASVDVKLRHNFKGSIAGEGFTVTSIDEANDWTTGRLPCTRRTANKRRKANQSSKPTRPPPEVPHPLDERLTDDEVDSDDVRTEIKVDDTQAAQNEQLVNAIRQQNKQDMTKGHNQGFSMSMIDPVTVDQVLSQPAETNMHDGEGEPDAETMTTHRTTERSRSNTEEGQRQISSHRRQRTGSIQISTKSQSKRHERTQSQPPRDYDNSDKGGHHGPKLDVEPYLSTHHDNGISIMTRMSRNMSEATAAFSKQDRVNRRDRSRLMKQIEVMESQHSQFKLQIKTSKEELITLSQQYQTELHRQNAEHAEEVKSQARKLNVQIEDQQKVTTRLEELVKVKISQLKTVKELNSSRIARVEKERDESRQLHLSQTKVNRDLTRKYEDVTYQRNDFRTKLENLEKKVTESARRHEAMVVNLQASQNLKLEQHRTSERKIQTELTTSQKHSSAVQRQLDSAFLKLATDKKAFQVKKEAMSTRIDEILRELAAAQKRVREETTKASDADVLLQRYVEQMKVFGIGIRKVTKKVESKHKESREFTNRELTTITEMDQEHSATISTSVEQHTMKSLQFQSKRSGSIALPSISIPDNASFENFPGYHGPGSPTNSPIPYVRGVGDRVEVIVMERDEMWDKLQKWNGRVGMIESLDEDGDPRIRFETGEASEFMWKYVVEASHERSRSIARTAEASEGYSVSPSNMDDGMELDASTESGLPPSDLPDAFGRASDRIRSFRGSLDLRFDEQREAWDEGDLVDVYSNGNGRWFPGKIEQIIHDMEGETLVVNYIIDDGNTRQKDVSRRDTSQIRPRTNSVDQD